MVMEYAENGSHHDYLSKKFDHLKWRDKISLLFNIIYGLQEIHENDVMHYDFHAGNILVNGDNEAIITDLGLSGLVDENLSEGTGIIGVMPFIASEVLSG